MATYVLVPGGFHGAWCWEKLTPKLTAAGHRVFPLALPGVGERLGEARPDTGLNSHVRDVVDVLVSNDLHDTILVGHSYGGLVITGVADRAIERIGHLVYFDALVPRGNQSLGDLLPLDIRKMRRAAVKRGEGWQVPPPSLHMNRIPGIDGLFGVVDETDMRWVRENLTPHPLKCFEERLDLRHPERLDSLPRTYIHCTGGGWLFRLSRRFKPAYLPPTDPGWHHRGLPTGHDAMITMPEETAGVLTDLA
ncbi:alpha/beta fold hydrolase [Streptomyces calidiresistens]|uniref:Alpha/beta fold hydrolase n=1 Tax=Streptomyces calidiresistens TaxID=1485586 RepID=A0A7W3T348_9ACTN|nr:alpha/beta fold hydrolase [Streptomyces calidiresistens]MBB0229996.1 alpha/beta fold hydrolase [Streptomyces calidiresistens]